MIDLTSDNIRAIAKTTGFIKDNVEKVMRLIDILEEIFSTKWKDKLVLKGDTAINMFYMDMPRLSVDIDLDYMGNDREEMLADKEALAIYLKNSLFQKNYSLSNASKSYFGLDSYVFQYLNNAENRDVIKVEINYLDRTHIFPVNRKKIDVLDYKGETEIGVLNRYELYGSKLAALIDRSEPRDVYDVYRMIQSQLLEDTETLKKCLIFYNCVGGDASILDFHSDKFNAMSKRDFDRMLKPMLSKSEKVDCKAAIDEIQKFLDKLLQFTAEERLFVEEFRNKNYSPEKLFDNHSIALRLAWHPMAFWKCGKTDSESQTIQAEAMKTALLMEGRGEDSLASMSDRDLLRQIRNFYKEKDEKFSELYNGKQVFPKEEENEEGLLIRIALFCDGDKERLLRIFKSSGQYKNNKPTEYYERMAENSIDFIAEQKQSITETKN